MVGLVPFISGSGGRSTVCAGVEQLLCCWVDDDDRRKKMRRRISGGGEDGVRMPARACQQLESTPRLHRRGVVADGRAGLGFGWLVITSNSGSNTTRRRRTGATAASPACIASKDEKRLFCLLATALRMVWKCRSGKQVAREHEALMTRRMGRWPERPNF